MNQKLEEEFEDIIGEAMEKASAIKCQFSDYVEGLELMLEELKDRLETAKYELNSQEPE